MDNSKSNGELRLDDNVVRAIFDFLPYPFLLARTRNGVTRAQFVNDKFVEEIGYSCEEIGSMPDWFSRAYPDAVYRAIVENEWKQRVLESAKEGSTKVTLQAIIQTKKKGAMWFEVTSSFIGEIEVVAFVNIHQTKLNESKLEMENINRDKMLSILGHDLRSPLASIISLTALFQQQMLTTEELESLMASIAHHVTHSFDLLETLLTWTRANFSKVSVQQELVDPAELAGKMKELFRQPMKEKSIEWIPQVASEPFLSDPAILLLVLRNLISNAIKFSPTSGRIVLDIQQSHSAVFLSVQDNGAGMDEETVRFITIDQTFTTLGTQREQGFGLGLRLCREFLPLINGKLDIETAPQKGTRMTITLPALTFSPKI